MPQAHSPRLCRTRKPMDKQLPLLRLQTRCRTRHFQTRTTICQTRQKTPSILGKSLPTSPPQASHAIRHLPIQTLTSPTHPTALSGRRDPKVHHAQALALSKTVLSNMQFVVIIKDHTCTAASHQAQMRTLFGSSNPPTHIWKSWMKILERDPSSNVEDDWNVLGFLRLHVDDPDTCFMGSWVSEERKPSRRA